jgi:hypothetical protein
MEFNEFNRKLSSHNLANHFDLGGKTLISKDLDGPMHLLNTEKSETYFKPKEFS